MPRSTARKIETSPNLVHAEVKRAITGSVSMTGSTTGSFSGVSGTAQALKFEDLLAVTSATLTITSTSNSPAAANLLRNGSTIASITGNITPNSTTTQAQTLHTTPIPSPSYSVSVPNDDGTVTGSITVNRESRWA